MNAIKPPRQGLGIGVTTTYLLERWITPFALFVGAESMLNYGVLASFLFALIGFLVFLCFSFFILRVKKQSPNLKSLSEWLSFKMDGSEGAFFQRILRVLYSLDIFILGVGGGVLWYAAFRLPMVIGTGISLVILGLISWIFDKTEWGRNYRIYILGIFFALLVFFIVYPFLVNPIQAIYDGIRLYHPYLLVIQEKELALYIMAVFSIFMGRILISPSAWKLVEYKSKMKIRSSLLLAGAIWATLPIAFSALLYPVISQGTIGPIEEVFYFVSRSTPSPIIKFVFLFMIGLIFLRAGRHIVRSIHSNEADLKFKNYILYMYIVPIAYVLYSIFQPTLLDLFFLIGIFYASILIPMLFMVIVEKHGGWMIPFTFLISCLFGLAIYVIEGRFMAIVGAVSISLFTMLLYKASMFFLNKITF